MWRPDRSRLTGSKSVRKWSANRSAATRRRHRVVQNRRSPTLTTPSDLALLQRLGRPGRRCCRLTLHFKDPVHQTHLTLGMTIVEWFSLPFAQRTHDFYTLYRGVSRLHRFEALCGFDYPFQFAMIALNYIIPVLYLPVLHMLRTFTFPFQQCQRTPIRRGFIRVDQPWNLPALRIVQKFTHKAICGFGVTTWRQVKINGAAPAVDGAVQISPASVDLHVGFIEMPWAKTGRLTPVPAQPLSISGA